MTPRSVTVLTVTPANLFAPPLPGSPGRFQQTAYTARVLASNKPILVPTFHTKKEPNLLGRIFRRLIPPRPAPRLEGYRQGDTQV